MASDTMKRNAFINKNKCKPKKCNQECKKSCPVNRIGKKCIEVVPTDKIAYISESLCIGCGICVKKCPFDAIKIINTPKNLEENVIFRYSQNSFKLHRLPIPRPGQVLGLIGTNGIGKTTAIKILSGKLKPNFGNFDNPPDWLEILRKFRGSELQNYFKKIIEDDLKAIIKPQYVDKIPKVVKGKVYDLLKKKCQKDNLDQIMQDLNLIPLKNREISDLSGGELQRFAIAIVCVQKADIYMFDEPSSYLDVSQRLKAAMVIRNLLSENNINSGKSTYVIVIEHDLSILDYLSDFVSCLYGMQGAYGVVTMPFSVREGINHFLSGFIPSENLRFRDFELNFKVADVVINKKLDENRGQYHYPNAVKSLGKFKLKINGGVFSDSEIVVLLGENGTGKTTLIKILAGIIKPDDKTIEMPSLSVSYKPQKIKPTFDGTVRKLFHKLIRSKYQNPQFVSNVIKPLMINSIIDREVKHLSGGELQRVAITLCLGKNANIYLIDEPSAYLDSEQRVVIARVIKRFILNSKKTAFVVEHDFIMATYLADKVIVYEGIPATDCTAGSCQSMVDGMNSFLNSLQITFRRDPGNYRPRINKKNSQKDQEQKNSGNYFYKD